MSTNSTMKPCQRLGLELGEGRWAAEVGTEAWWKASLGSSTPSTLSPSVCDKAPVLNFRSGDELLGFVSIFKLSSATTHWSWIQNVSGGFEEKPGVSSNASCASDLAPWRLCSRFLCCWCCSRHGFECGVSTGAERVPRSFWSCSAIVVVK